MSNEARPPFGEQVRAWAFPQHVDEGGMWLTWLVRLRWMALFAQLVTVGFSLNVLEAPTLTLSVMGGLMLSLVVSNLWALRHLNSGHPVPEDQLLRNLLLDITILTLFFVMAGGPDNPFHILYLIHVSMAVVMLRPSLWMALVAAVLVLYGLIHPFHQDLRLDRHLMGAERAMMAGHAVAFVATTISVSIFAGGVSVSLRRRKQQLMEARERTARTDRLRSVGTLAAGAAHELNTPLSTIGLRLRRVGRRYQDDETLRDLQVMSDQLDRCKHIVEQLLVGAGDPSASGLRRAPLAELVRQSTRLWAKGSSIEAVVSDHSDGAEVELPGVAFVQALTNLLENAREAQEAVDRFDPLQVDVLREGQRVVVQVADRGCGLPEARDQIGTPFFTTKATGTGLGVFVAQSLADGAGGGLSYVPHPDGGTIACWWFPVAAERKP